MNVFRHVARIEAIDVVADGEGALAERARLLEDLERQDFSGLSSEERRELRRRLQRVLQNDADVILEARAEMREIDQNRKQLKHGRRAAQGYRAAQPNIEAAFRRSA